MKTCQVELEYPENKTIHELLEDIAAVSPDSIALVWGEEHLTYGDLNERANRVAHAIRQFYRLLYNLEMTPDTPIGIFIK